MKLRNLLFGTMIACAFVACSNDDDPTLGPENPTTGDVKTTIAFAVKGPAVETKAQTSAEETVKSLRVILYTAAGKYVASTVVEANKDKVDDKREVEFSDLRLPDGVTSYKVLAIANLSTTFSDDVAATLPAIVQGAPFGTADAAIADAGLPMSSGVSAAFDVVIGKANYYGYKGVESIVSNEKVNNIGTDPLPLIRNVARVDLKKVTLDLNASSKKPNYTEISASVNLQGAFILHARTKAVAADLTSTPSWWNSTSGNWGTIAAQYTSTTDELMSGVGTFDNEVGSTDAIYNKTFTDKTISQTTTAAASTDLSDISFYILENDQTSASRELADKTKSHTYATELVIKGEYEVTKAVNGNGTYKYDKAVRYWPIKIGIDNNSPLTGAGAGSVHRNYIYTIENATIAGSGMKDPTTPEPEALQLFVRTTVTDWGKVNQDPVIE